MPEVLRVVDFGRVTPLRSQTLWHALAYGVSGGAPPTLSFVRPAAPYVCVGYHRRLDEVDAGYCREHGLPVYRRMAGGGPVYLDAGQLFFQICLPAAMTKAARLEALRALLAPAVAAFRAAGVTASLGAGDEICAGGRKICGHGAVQIEDAVVVCGNLIERFDHYRATRVLALPEPAHRTQTLRLMRQYVAATPARAEDFRNAMIRAYAEALGLRPRAGKLTLAERRAVSELDDRFLSDEWLAGPPVPAARRATAGVARQVKIKAGVWTFAASSGTAKVVASVVAGRVDRAVLRAPGLNGSRTAAERALTGIPLAAAPAVLARFGDPGRQLAAAIAAADEKRI